MSILWITPGFAASEQDFNCIPPMQLLASALLRRGVDLHIIALEYPFAGTAYPWGNPAGMVYPCNGQNRRWLRWRTATRARAIAQRVFQDKKITHIHSFWLGPAWVLGEQLANRWGAPHCTTLMGQDVRPANWYTRRLNAAQAHRLVALTAFHNDVLEKTTGLRAGHCIPWGISAQDIPEDLPVSKSTDILGVGSLVPVKNWARWLRVLRLVADHRPAVRAVLAGDGPEIDALRALAVRLQLERQVTFAGELPRPQVLDMMRNSRVLLHTAHFESFGYVLAEAAVNGCRIVSTPVGTAPDLGVCSNSDPGLAAAIIQALDMQAPATAPIGLALMEAVAEAYMSLYTSAA